MKQYKTYRFKEQDPMIAETLGLLDGMSDKEVADKAGISRGTLGNWRRKKNKRAYFSTIAAVGGATGRKLKWVRNND